jgi:hypothetical protein
MKESKNYSEQDLIQSLKEMRPLAVRLNNVYFIRYIDFHLEENNYKREDPLSPYHNGGAIISFNKQGSLRNETT